MLSTRLSNHTTHPHVRVRVDITIGYDQSIDAAREALLATLAGDERIVGDPAASVGVVECGPRGVALALNFWVADKSIEKLMRGEYLEKAKKALDAAGIAIPYPHVQVILPLPQVEPMSISEAA
jgi:small-conductance mechanosensitive channel